jgi:tetratricopeptide (TPR) repeat protein
MAGSGWRSKRNAPLGAAILLLAGCGVTPHPARPRPVPASLRVYMPSPAPLARDDAAAWQTLYGRLIAGEDPAAVADAAAALGARDAAPNAATLLGAEVELVAGDASGALAKAAGGFEWQLQLVAGRAAEELGDPVEASGHYRRAESDSPAAAARAQALAGPAADAIAGRVESSLEQGRADEASDWISRLAELQPTSDRTFELEARTSRQRGDEPGELRAVTELLRRHPARDDWIFRRAQLETDTGDPSGALQLLEGLAARHPDDSRIAPELARSKFQFRLSNVPQDVRELAARPELTRADFARLLYWLMPGVRSAHGGVPPIATDLVDHPAREEILKVLSLGLMQVDGTLHLFAPDAPVDRSAVLRALLGRSGVGGPAACARTGLERGDLCSAATACRLLREDAECLPTGALGGHQAVDWIEAAGEVAGGGS